MTEEERAAQVLNEAMRKLLKHELRKKWDAQPPPTPKPETPEPSHNEGRMRTIVLDCRPPSTYRAFRVIEGGQQGEKPTAAPGAKPGQ